MIITIFFISRIVLIAYCSNCSYRFIAWIVLRYCTHCFSCFIWSFNDYSSFCFAEFDINGAFPLILLIFSDLSICMISCLLGWILVSLDFLLITVLLVLRFNFLLRSWLDCLFRLLLQFINFLKFTLLQNLFNSLNVLIEVLKMLCKLKFSVSLVALLCILDKVMCPFFLKWTQTGVAFGLLTSSMYMRMRVYIYIYIYIHIYIYARH